MVRVSDRLIKREYLADFKNRYNKIIMQFIISTVWMFQAKITYVVNRSHFSLNIFRF